MSFEKNVAEYNLFAIKLSSEKMLDHFFVWLPIKEKISRNWGNLDLANFFQKLAAESVVKTNTSQSIHMVQFHLTSLIRMAKNGFNDRLIYSMYINMSDILGGIYRFIR